jgi:hypothetical protein
MRTIALWPLARFMGLAIPWVTNWLIFGQNLRSYLVPNIAAYAVLAVMLAEIRHKYPLTVPIVGLLSLILVPAAVVLIFSQFFAF